MPAALKAWAARPGTASVLAWARERLEAGRAGDRVSIDVDPAHRSDVGRLLGLEWEVSGRPVTMKLLGAAVTRAGADLATLLEATGGPLRDRPAERAANVAARAQHRRDLETTLTDAGLPGIFAELVLGKRWLGSDPQVAARSAAAVAAVWPHLPRPPGTGTAAAANGSAPGATSTRGLAELASQVLGDPHALDRNRPEGRAMARVLAAAFVAETVAQSDADTPIVAAAAGALRAREWRAIWLRAGVLCDQVSATVLLLNTPMTGRSPALEAVTGVRGEPVWVTARMVAGGCFYIGTDPVVRVCENPAVVEAAAGTLGSASAPLVCLYGRPSSAAWAVLAAIVGAGAQLQVSTDRDTAGLQIAEEVHREMNEVAGAPATVQPWLPDADGLFEEERLAAMLDDLACGQHP